MNVLDTYIDLFNLYPYYLYMLQVNKYLLSSMCKTIRIVLIIINTSDIQSNHNMYAYVYIKLLFNGVIFIIINCLSDKKTLR